MKFDNPGIIGNMKDFSEVTPQNSPLSTRLALMVAMSNMMTADTTILVIDIPLKYNHYDCHQKLSLPERYLYDPAV